MQEKMRYSAYKQLGGVLSHASTKHTVCSIFPHRSTHFFCLFAFIFWMNHTPCLQSMGVEGGGRAHVLGAPPPPLPSFFLRSFFPTT